MGKEETSVIELAMKQYKKTKNVAYLAIGLNFTLGLRVGEFVALKKEDFSEKVVHIQRQEVKKYIHDESGAVKRDGYEVVWYTKTRVTFFQRNRWKIEYLPTKRQSVAKCRM